MKRIKTKIIVLKCKKEIVLKCKKDYYKDKARDYLSKYIKKEDPFFQSLLLSVGKITKFMYSMFPPDY